MPDTDDLKILPRLMLAALPAFLLTAMANLPGSPFRQTPEEPAPYIWLLVMGLTHGLPLALALWYAALQVGNSAAGKWAVVALILSTAILVHPQMPRAHGGYAGWCTHTILKGLPVVLWGWRIFGAPRFAPFLGFLLWTPAYFALSSGASAFFSLESLRWTVATGDRTQTVIYFLPHVFLFFVPVLSYILLLFVWRHTRQGWQHFSALRLSLEPPKSRTAALILFVGFKFIILQMALGMSYLRAFLIHTDSNFKAAPWADAGYTMHLNYLISMLMLVLVLYLYRKFLLEYFFQLGWRPGYLFWGLQIPLLGELLFVCLWMLARDKPPYTAQETFKNSQEQENGVGNIRILLLLVQLATGILLLLNASRDQHTAGVLSVALGIMLSIFYLFNYKALYWLFALLILQFISMVQVDIQHNMFRIKFMDAYFQSVMGFAVAYAMSGVLHLRRFHLEENTPATAGPIDENAPLDAF
jgi:hypothetical protein